MADAAIRISEEWRPGPRRAGSPNPAPFDPDRRPPEHAERIPTGGHLSFGTGAHRAGRDLSVVAAPPPCAVPGAALFATCWHVLQMPRQLLAGPAPFPQRRRRPGIRPVGSNCVVRRFWFMGRRSSSPPRAAARASRCAQTHLGAVLAEAQVGQSMQRPVVPVAGGGTDTHHLDRFVPPAVPGQELREVESRVRLPGHWPVGTRRSPPPRRRAPPATSRAVERRIPSGHSPQRSAARRAGRAVPCRQHCPLLAVVESREAARAQQPDRLVGATLALADRGEQPYRRVAIKPRQHHGKSEHRCSARAVSTAQRQLPRHVRRRSRRRPTPRRRTAHGHGAAAG